MSWSLLSCVVSHCYVYHFRRVGTLLRFEADGACGHVFSISRSLTFTVVVTCHYRSCGLYLSDLTRLLLCYATFSQNYRVRAISFIL